MAEEFCAQIHPNLVGVLVLQCKDPRLAEEVAQEALARAWERWPSVATMEFPEAWVYRVSFTVLYSYFRRRAAERRAYQKSPLLDDGEVPDPAVALAVRQAVAGLPARERQAVALRYFADLSVEATAAAMGCRPGTVKSLTHHAMEHLRPLLDEIHDFTEEVTHGA